MSVPVMDPLMQLPEPGKEPVKPGTMGNVSVPGVVPGKLDPSAGPTPQTQPQAPPTPPPTAMSMSQITPQNTIRATQINPVSVNRQPLDAAMGGGVGTDRLRELSLRSAEGLQGPDRGQIAQDTLQRLIQSTRPDYENELRTVNKMAAAGGRLGAGITTTRLGDVRTNRDQFITDAAERLASEAAGQTLSDRLGVLSGTSGALSNFSGIDRGNLSDRANVEAQRFNQDLTNRDELRGERTYQDQLARYAHDDTVQRLMLENSLLDSAFNRDQRRLDSIGGTGYGGQNPAIALGQGADYYGNQANQSVDASAQLLAELARRRA